MIRIAEPRIGDREREAVLDVLASGRLTGGPYTQRLEEAFAREVAGTRYAVAVSSGTAALHLALLAHGIGPGDEVITTPFSFQATANMVLATGARPVFADVTDDGNLDPAAVEAAITPRTRALLPVHLYGRLCDMQALCDIAARHNLAIIEDAAQAHGAMLGPAAAGSATPNAAGSFGTGCFSLYATKNLTAGEGGIVTTNDPEIARRVRRLRAHGEEERYESLEVGFNYRITEVGAALAMAQLGGLNEGNARRRQNAAYLSTHLHGVLPPLAPANGDGHVWHQYTVCVSDEAFGRPEVQGSHRDALQRHLRERDIEAVVYYPKTLPAQKLYREMGYDDAAFPTARRLTHEVLSLPVHPGLTEADLDAIAGAVNEWVDTHTKGKVSAS